MQNSCVKSQNLYKIRVDLRSTLSLRGSEATEAIHADLSLQGFEKAEAIQTLKRTNK